MSKKGPEANCIVKRISCEGSGLPKSIQKSTKSHEKVLQKRDQNRAANKMRFWSIFGSILPPKWSQKPSKNQHKNQGEKKGEMFQVKGSSRAVRGRWGNECGGGTGAGKQSLT